MTTAPEDHGDVQPEMNETRGKYDENTPHETN